jgi:hypothetical protein
MKKLFSLFAIIFISASTFAQTDSTKSKVSFYSSLGVSIGHVDPADPAIDNFNKASYPSLEVGLMKGNFGLGAVVGCENMFTTSTSRGFYELKTSISHPIGSLTGYALFGVGAYMESGFNNFLEYGAGFSYAPTKLGYFVQYSNWARSNYISAGITYNF